MAESPTATALVTNELLRFLRSSTPEVVCIRGNWGVGKTYLWNDLIEKNKTDIALKKYAYVSLFGVQTLDDLKYSIFEHTIKASEIGIEPNLDTLKSNTDFVVTKVGKTLLSTILQSAPWTKGAAGSIQALSFLSVSERLICIDDLERRGKNLRIIDILGLVSFLRERRNCKVVLILNDEELSPEDRTALEKYQEKVIDVSLLFAPNETDCVDIALRDRAGATKLLAERAVMLGISNIRVIKKIERLVLQVEPMLAGLHQQVLVQAVQTLTLFGWLHFGRSDEHDALLDYILKGRAVEKGDEENAGHKKEWDDLLDRYRFGDFDDLDSTLLDGIKNGFFDDEKLKRQAKALDAQRRVEESLVSLNAAWAALHGSLDDNAEEVVAGLVEAIEANIELVPPATLNSFVVVMKQLGHPEIVAPAIELYMESRGSEERSFYDLESHPFFSAQYSDPDVKKAFEDKLATFKLVADPVEILTRIQTHQGWSNDDIAQLSAMSVADYKKLFKSLKDLQMRTVIRAATGFEHIGNRGTQYDVIINNAKQALAEIAAESAINRIRVRN